MRKLEKRESIIVGVMAIAILYGAISLLFTKPQKKTSYPAAASSEVQALASAVTTIMSKGSRSSREAYVITRAELEWQHDPFAAPNVFRELLRRAEAPKAGAASPKVAFNYTGYLEYGGKQVAIINGVEYAVGEVLEKPGYVLRSITPIKVIIEDIAGRSTIKIPIQD